MNLSTLVISWIRTGVPVVVGFLVTWLAGNLHIVLSQNSETQLTALAVAAVISAYYAVARFLETKFPNSPFKYLLGVPAKVSYEKPPA
jgi:hypothetical protein